MRSKSRGKKFRRFSEPPRPKKSYLRPRNDKGINLVAQTYGKKFFRPGDEIVLTTLEHHANIVPWQMIAKETGAVIRVVPVTDRGEIMMEAYQALLGPRMKFVSLQHTLPTAWARFFPSWK